MRTLVLQKEIEPLPIKNESELISSYEGILTSNYKEIAKKNFFVSNNNSIHGNKQRVKSRLYTYSLPVDAILKLSVFAIILTAII